MSTAVFPQGTESYNNSKFSPFTADYRSWKGTGNHSFPIGITSGNIRPLTNKDYTNNAFQRQGLPRPLKWQYRKGKTTQKQVTVINPNKPDEYIVVNRESNSSKTSSLIGQLIDRPGQFIVKHNPENEINGRLQLNEDCQTCKGIGLVSDFKPETFLTNNPEPSVCSPTLCCNQESKALKNVIYASTNLKKNYFTTLQQYRQNRCQTYNQKAFNFQSAVRTSEELSNPNISLSDLQNSKPGDPLSYLNLYLANCYPNTDTSISSQYGFVLQIFELIKNQNVLTNNDIINFTSQQIQNFAQLNIFLNNIEGNSTEALNIYHNFLNNPYLGVPLSGPSNPKGCKLVVYKPSNPQFAVQGGVSSSTRILKLTNDTISSNLASIRKLKGYGTTANIGQQPYTPFIYKNKVSQCTPGTFICNPGYYIKDGNPKTCFKNSDDYMYKAYSKLGNISGQPMVPEYDQSFQ